MPPFNARLDEVGMPKPSFKWRRVLLKVSGEALAGDQTQNIDPKVAYETYTAWHLVRSSFSFKGH